MKREDERRDPPAPETTPGARAQDARRALGDEGERRAASFLKRRGYRILERNVRYDRVEIDLIARRGATVVFVEVKTRRSQRFGAPECAVDAHKQARIVRAARAWLRAHPNASSRVRFDVVSCTVERHEGRDHWQIEHLAAAFAAGD